MAYKSLDHVTVSDISSLGINLEQSEKLHQLLTGFLQEHGNDAVGMWKSISKRLLRPNHPFSLHQMMYYGCYINTNFDPPPFWIPDLESAVTTNLGKMLEIHAKRFLGSSYKDPISSFSDFQKFSVSKPEVYWELIFKEMNISFSVPPSCIFEKHTSDENPGGKWLSGAYMNSAECCLSLKGNRSVNDVAIIWREEGYDDMPMNRLTLQELRADVYRVAHALDTLGLDKGSAIAIDMPMSVIAVVIYLAIVLAGYVVVSIADSFAADEISTRIKISNTKAIFTQDYIVRGEKKLPLYSRIVEAKAPIAIVIAARSSMFPIDLRECDIPWTAFLKRVKVLKCHDYSAVHQSVNAFTNILFSSGTTGEPKAIPWTHATPLKAAADAWSHMDVREGDVVAWPTNLGWMMGPWLVYASLINGASMALYNGSPLGDGFRKFVQDAKVTMLGIVPSIVRSWKNANWVAGYDWSAIRCFSSTGEASNADEYLWLTGRAHYKPIIEYCGGTEIGGAFVSGTLLQPQSLAAFSTPAMGCAIYILGNEGNPLPEETPGIGELALDPVMFGASTTLLNANHYDVYFKGMPLWNGKVLRRHGDEFERTVTGYYRAHGRADDTMNLGGIKISSVEIERVCNGANDDVLETAAIGVPPVGGGPDALVIAVVFKENSSKPNLDHLKMAFNSSIQKKLNPLFKVSSIITLSSLPRTASNKVMRRIIRNQFTQKNSPRL